MSLIYKTLAVAIGISIVYILNAPAFKRWFTTQTQWQRNVVRGQDFLYSQRKSAGMIVGSSLAERIVKDSLKDVTNISFSGLGILDGLKLLSTRPLETLPKVLFIEMNTAQRPENVTFTNTLLTPLNYYPKKWLPALRDNKQPLGIAGYYINHHFTKPILQTFKARTTPKPSTGASNHTLFAAMLADQQKTYAQKPKAEELEANMKRLAAYVKQFSAHQIKIVFFEMPVHPSLTQLPKATTIRQAFYTHFPPNRYSYIPFPQPNTYTTSDGLHLLPDEARNYTHYFKNQIVPYVK